MQVRWHHITGKFDAEVEDWWEGFIFDVGAAIAKKYGKKTGVVVGGMLWSLFVDKNVNFEKWY